MERETVTIKKSNRDGYSRNTEKTYVIDITNCKLETEYLENEIRILLTNSISMLLLREDKEEISKWLNITNSIDQFNKKEIKVKLNNKHSCDEDQYILICKTINLNINCLDSQLALL